VAQKASFITSSPYHVAQKASFVTSSPYHVAQKASFITSSPYHVAQKASFVTSFPQPRARYRLDSSPFLCSLINSFTSHSQITLKMATAVFAKTLEKLGRFDPKIYIELQPRKPEDKNVCLL
jgi:hypothetical protein